MIRLIATDLDGTLLDTEGAISPRSADAVRRAREKGVIVCIATGRIHSTCAHFHRELGLDSPIIAVNGAWIQHCEEILERHPLPQDAFEDGLRIAEKREVSPMAVIEDKMAYLAEDKRYLDVLLGFYEDRSCFMELNSRAEMIERMRASGCERLTFIGADTGVLSSLRAELTERFAGQLEVSSSWATNIEIGKAGISKGYAVGRLAEIFRIPREEVMTLGDHDNDVSMLRYAGYSVAMGNACEAAKAAARYETDTNGDEGFAKALERFVL